MDDRVAKLLVKAVRTLPQREQDQVFTALLRDVISGSGPFTRPELPSAPPELMFLSDPAASFRIGPMEASGPTAMFPVRLPPELHERLRRWSAEHGFSMASVVRGLVERFLDEQASAKPSSRPRTAGRKRPARRSPTAGG